MNTAVQITIAVCSTIVVLAVMFVCMVWIAGKQRSKNNQKG